MGVQRLLFFLADEGDERVFVQDVAIGGLFEDLGVGFGFLDEAHERGYSVGRHVEVAVGDGGAVGVAGVAGLFLDVGQIDLEWSLRRTLILLDPAYRVLHFLHFFHSALYILIVSIVSKS